MSDLANIVHSSAWPYLVEVHQRLKVSIDLVDSTLTSVLSAGDRSLADGERVFELFDEPVRLAIARSMNTQQPEQFTIDGATVICAPLAGRGGEAAGAILLTSRAQQRSSSRGGSSKLARIGTWLASAVSLHLSSTGRLDTSELDRFSSLYRLLKHAMTTGSEREVIRTFVEALAFWQDAESFAYVANLNGQFVLDLALPGSDRATVPPMIEADRVAGDLTTARPAPADLDAMGFHGTDVIFSRAGRDSSSDWLIAVCDAIDPRAEARVAVYAEAVSQALGEMAAVQSTRLTWALLQHLLPSTASSEAAARGAIEELAGAIRGRAYLSVSRQDGARLLTIGEAADIVSPPVPTRDPRVLTLSIDLPPPYRAVLGVIRDGDTPLTRRDELLVRSTVSTLAAWLPSAAPRLPVERERRTGQRSFDQIIEQQASTIMAGGHPVSIIVISLGNEPAQIAAAQECVAQLRRLLRPTDMAGRLLSGHIGVVLPDTPEDGASIVADRVHELVTSSDDFALFPNASIGFASRAPGAAAPSLSLLLEAWARMGAKHAKGRVPASVSSGPILAS